MALRRTIDWPEKMHDFIEENIGKPFAWGTNDCALFVCNHILAITGTDVATDFRGKYSDEAGAKATIADVAKGTTVEDAAVFVTGQNDMPELQTVRMAQRGDVVIFDSANGPAMGFVHMNGIHALFVSDKGLSKIKVSLCRRAWRVG